MHTDTAVADPVAADDALDAAQAAAVAYRGGPLLVEAGPGSGKTRVITHRAASLIDDGIDPSSLLAITFTNRAANEMRRRLVALAGVSVGRMWCSTFHSACSRILRVDGPQVGCPTGFKILDDAASTAACRQAMQHLGVDLGLHRPRNLRAVISAAKNSGIDAEAFMRLARRQDADPDMGLHAEVFDQYQRRLVDTGGVDFDDLLLLVERLLRTDDDARQRWQHRFRHVLIDEYQDTNIVQHRIAVALTEASGQLTAVGDSDQAIYAFRGADITNITELRSTFPNLEVMTLDRNYRSTRRVVAVSAAMIRHNRTRPAKTLHTDRHDGDPIVVCAAVDERDEAAWVTADIARRITAGASARDIAVMFRTNAQSRPFENALTDANIAFRLRSGVPFHDRRDIRDAIAHITAAVEPRNDAAVAVALNAPARGVGPKALALLRQAASDAELPLIEILNDHRSLGLWAAASDGIDAYLAARGVICDTLRRHPGDAARVAEVAVDASGMRAALQADDTIASAERLETLNELIAAAGEHPDVEAFLTDAADRRRRHRKPTEGIDAVDVMSMHASKGLEYLIVYVTGFEDDLIPHLRAGNAAAIEEERRLAYVAMTRAVDTLTLTRARRRRLLTGGGSAASRFLNELPAEHLTQRTTPQHDTEAAEAASSAAGCHRHRH